MVISLHRSSATADERCKLNYYRLDAAILTCWPIFLVR
jgi:hypothetical protein